MDRIVLSGLEVTGNKRTKTPVILQELPFRLGDTIALADLPSTIERAENNLMNTGLFVRVQITYQDWSGSSMKVTLLIDVQETWYLYPVPKLDFADRNFNVWWQDQGRALDRLILGLDLSHLNLTGWGDELEIGLEYGYTRALKFRYQRPYLNKARTLGLLVEYELNRNREVHYATEENKQLFFERDNAFMRRRVATGTRVWYRPDIYRRHNFYAYFHHDQVDTSISQRLNPLYFPQGGENQRFFRLGYAAAWDYRDNFAYPWDGYRIDGEIQKDGFGIFNERNALTLLLNAEKYWATANKKWSLGTAFRSKYSVLRGRQSLLYNQGVGFGANKLSGYQLYLMDGLDAVLFKTNLRREIFRGEVNFGKWVFLEAFRRVPFRFNLSWPQNVGYVNSPYNSRENPFTNQWVWGTGFAVDLVLYFNFVFRFEASINQTGETGFFLDFDAG
ncbi:MAG: POTRA domain-containing protein, partial [Bacteroidota bacterium]